MDAEGHSEHSPKTLFSPEFPVYEMASSSMIAAQKVL